MILGVMVYLLYASLFGHYQSPGSVPEKLRAYVLLALLAGIMAHFVEINFGIAIAATRTYFWAYAALLMLAGYVLPLYDQYGMQSAEDEARIPSGGNEWKSGKEQKGKQRSGKSGRSAPGRKRRAGVVTSARNVKTYLPDWLQEALLTGFIIGILLVTLGFAFVSNGSRAQEAYKLVWNSLTLLKDQPSFGVLALMVTCWLVGAILMVSESSHDNLGGTGRSLAAWLKTSAVALIVSLLIAVIFWLWHASNLADLVSIQANNIEDVIWQVQRSEGILTLYYGYLFVLLFGMALILPVEWPITVARRKVLSVGAAIAAMIAAFLLASVTNLRVIQADIAFKTADLFANAQNWQPAIAVYQRARELAPNEDYYYLFLGRAYLEQAKKLDDVEARERFINQAAQDLREAQSINPLNTDHTANLARLYSLWSTLAADQQRRNELASASEDYFTNALMLSPNNARLWDEWATLYLNLLKLPEEAFARLSRALELDPYFDWTYGLLGDYYASYHIDDPDLSNDERLAALEKAAEYYAQAIDLAGSANTQQQLSYYLALAGVQTQLGRYEQAIGTYEQALPLAGNQPNLWQLMETLARLYVQVGDQQSALAYATQALDSAPDDQKERLSSLVIQLGGQP
jgi:tetratricopeptide (TPR) repeat protein